MRNDDELLDMIAREVDLMMSERIDILILGIMSGISLFISGYLLLEHIYK